MEQETVMKKTLLTTLAVASSLAFACVANAAENNPFGLVYKGAKFLSLQFFELYRADPDFRYQLLQVLQE